MPVRPRVTDHALVRFLERSGFEMERLRGAMELSLSAAHGAAVALGGADHLIKIGGMTFVVRGEDVTTVLLAGEAHDQAHALRQPEPK